jgi:hypothetical protein
MSPAFKTVYELLSVAPMRQTSRLTAHPYHRGRRYFHSEATAIALPFFEVGHRDSLADGGW